MKHIEYRKIVDTVATLCISACYELPEDVLACLAEAAAKESNPSAVMILKQLIENAQLAADERIPLCQDTGLAVVFIEQGLLVSIDNDQSGEKQTIIDAVNAGIEQGYKRGLLRKSVVTDPLKNRSNTGTNTPAIVHYSVVPGDKLKISVMAKGGGCENKSQFKMFRPTASAEEVGNWIIDVVKNAGADACPPFIVGVGIGGNFEYSCLLSKRALLCNLSQANADSFYADMEKTLLEKINQLGIGPQGLGGDTTALAVLIETAPCHIASLPVAVNIECHSHRHKSITL
jgi:fumarate hydratase subunit alpha